MVLSHDLRVRPVSDGKWNQTRNSQGAMTESAAGEQCSLALSAAGGSEGEPISKQVKSGAPGVDVVQKRCVKDGCPNYPSFGVAGSGKAEYCSEHAFQGLIEISLRQCAADGCSKNPSYGVPGVGKRVYCAVHALEGMVNVISKKCVEDGCSKQPSYGVFGSGKREYCARHALEGMVDVVSKKCTYDGCLKRPTYGMAGSGKREYCARHALEGMVDNFTKRCARDGCRRAPSFGAAGSRKREYCADHALEGMVDVASKKCASVGCLKSPTYGVAGSGKRDYCAGHAQEGMVDNMTRRCARDGCSTIPSFGVAGSRKREYCVYHALEGMVDVVSLKCGNHECLNPASYGVPGSGKREYCAEHALEGMIDVSTKTCTKDGCSKRPTCGVAKSGKPRYCAKHALEGMVDIVSMKCASDGCSTLPSYGVGGSSKREYCARHALEGMVEIFKRKCAGEGCFKRPTYGMGGTGKPSYCPEHALEGMINVTKKCASAGCSKRPTHGVAGSGKREYCAGHALELVANSMPKKCASEGCFSAPIYGVPGNREQWYCDDHASEGIVNIGKSRCAVDGCTKQASNGRAGGRERLYYCDEHSFMEVEATIKSEFPSDEYSDLPENTISRSDDEPIYIAEDASEGMVDIVSMKYGNDGCPKLQIYGQAGNSKHSSDVMVDIDSKGKCGSDGFSKSSSYGVAGSRKRKYCLEHPLGGIDNSSPGDESSKQLDYGVATSLKPEYLEERYSGGTVEGETEQDPWLAGKGNTKRKGGGIVPPPAEVTEAIFQYKAPEGYIAEKPPDGSTSVMWDWGVMLRTTAGEHVEAIKGFPKGPRALITAMAVCDRNAVSRKTAAAKESAETSARRATQEVNKSSLTGKDPARFMAMMWVKCNIIQGLRPLSSGEKEWERKLWAVCGHPDFPVASLHHDAVRNKVVELYAATSGSVKAELKREIDDGVLLHLGLDLWVDKVSSLTFMGVRVFYVTMQWKFRSRLLSVRQFIPGPEVLGTNRLSELLSKYLKTVLEEFDLIFSDLFSATSHVVGSDKKRLYDVLIPYAWERCLCHMLSCALVEALGAQADPRVSTNTVARRVISAVKNVVEHVNKSPRAKAIFNEEQMHHLSQCTRRNLVPQRWCGVSGVLEAILVNWDAIDAIFTQKGESNPITEWEIEISELYSLIKPCTDVIVQCQQTNTPTGHTGVLGLASLKLTTLDPESELDILSPSHELARGDLEGIDVGEELAACRSRKPGELTFTGKATREKLRDAVDRHWFNKRYQSRENEDTDFLFDMQMAVNPETADLAYLKHLAPNAARAAEVKRKIMSKVVDLAVRLAKKAAKGDSPSGAEVPAKCKKRSANGSGSDDGKGSNIALLSIEASSEIERSKRDKLSRLRLLTQAESTFGDSEPSLEGEVRAEHKTFRELKEEARTGLTGAGVLAWWGKWQYDFPLLARVARVVFGAPAASKVLERDFSNASWMMTSSTRISSSDAGLEEMVLFLHGSQEIIPAEVPQLTVGEEVESKIPVRLREPNPELQARKNDPVLSFGHDPGSRRV